jgi:hypothetical protein
MCTVQLLFFTFGIRALLGGNSGEREHEIPPRRKPGSTLCAIYLKNFINSIKNYFKKHPYVLVTLVIAFIWIIINGIEADKYAELLKKEGLYTLATIDNIKGAKSGTWLIVKFNYNGRLYETKERNETVPASWIGEKIFVKFLPSEPEVADILEDAYVTDSLTKEPDTIWKDLPFTQKPKSPY